MTGIFISYRREDSAGHAGRLSDILCGHFDPKQLFVDLNSIKPGEAFPDVIDQNLAASRVLLAVIGTRWLTVADSKGQGRLKDPRDMVRREIATALDRHIKVIPVLVGGAKMPRAADLPVELASLAQCQAVEVSDAGFGQDVAKLVEVLHQLVRPLSPASKKTKTLRLRAEKATLSGDDVKVMLATHGFYDSDWNKSGKGIDPQYTTMVQAGAVVVFDKATNLMWQKSSSEHDLMFEQTGSYIHELNERKFAGFTDWRMPTLEEAMSLMSASKHGDYHLAPEFDGGVIMWTSDSCTRAGDAWIVYFYDGFCRGENVKYHGPIRAVRAVPPTARHKEK